jgi:hypothetical protein
MFLGHGGDVVNDLGPGYNEISSKANEWGFRSRAQHWQGFLTPRRALLAWEHSSDTNGFLHAATNFFQLTEDHLKLAKPISAVAYEAFALAPQESFNAAREVVNRNIFCGRSDWAPLPGAPGDLLAVFEYPATEDGVMTNVRIAPLSKSELTTRPSSMVLTFPEAVTKEASCLVYVRAWMLNQDNIRKPLRAVGEMAEGLCEKLVEAWFKGNDRRD